MKNIRVGKFILAMCVPLIMGMISAALSAQGMAAYGEMVKPPLSPPAWVFSAAWTILYLMMGFAAYRIMVSMPGTQGRGTALLLFWSQLIMNFFWSLIFFRWEQYLTAFIWLIVMWSIVVACTMRFYNINKMAGWLLVPYVLWLSFAAYLNLGAWMLSRA